MPDRSDRIPRRNPNCPTVEAARENLFNFTLYTKHDYRPSWHHEALCQELDDFVAGKILRMMVFKPPQRGKTELCSRRLPAYILGKNPDARVIGTSYGADLAASINRDIQRIIDSDEYAEVFPGTTLYGKNVRTTAREVRLRNSDEFEVVGHSGFYKCAGVGGPIAGRPGDYIIIDDVIKDRKEAESPTYRRNVVRWYTGVVYGRRSSENAQILIVMTRWHENDLAGHLLAEADANPKLPQWRVVRFPELAEPDGKKYWEMRHPADKREDGEPLWPVRYSKADAETTRGVVGTYDWASVYQQRPAPSGGGIFKEIWWRFWHYKGKPLPPVPMKDEDGNMVDCVCCELPTFFDDAAQSWDMAFKDTKSSAYVVGEVWKRKDANAYLLDLFRKKIDFVKSKDAVLDLTEKWPEIVAKLIEDKANGPAIISALRGYIAGIVAVNPEGSKEARAYAVSPVIESGNVYLPHPQIAPWVTVFIDECSGFPNGTYADQVDSMTQVLNRFMPSMNTVNRGYVKPEDIKHSATREAADELVASSPKAAPTSEWRSIHD